ncbi:MAG: S8 family serine peptidase [Pyrinomonadaceae bacterium]
MNRQNFLGHLALALSLILVAAFAGQLRRWEKNFSEHRTQRECGSKDKVRRQTATDSTRTVLVKFRDNQSASDIEDTIAAHHDQVTDKIEALDDRLVAIYDLDNIKAESVASEYNSLPGVEYAEVNQEIDLAPNEATQDFFNDDQLNELQVPNDPQFAEQWGLQNTGQRGGQEAADIHALDAWKQTKGDRRVIVAVLDSGVDYTHSDLVGNMWTRPDNLTEYFDNELGYANDRHGFNAVDNLADPMDENGHGTHCAGIIGAEGDNHEGIAGVNWQVQIMPLKFIGPSGSGSTKDAIEAINYVIERKRAGVNVRIISASWGSRANSKALEDVIRRAGEEGILFVAAAGNSSVNTDTTPHYPSSYDLPNVLSVAATDRNDQLTSFSNYGPKSVQIAAPGADVLSTWLGNAFEEHSGTSMAAPMVSGVAALIIAAEPNISMTDLRARLLDSADKLPQLKGKVASGGRLNAARAVGAN